MAKKIIILLFLISFSVITYAQLKNAPKINVGIARRPELFELENDFFRPRYTKGYQFYGLSYMKPTALALELSQRLNHERWLVQFSNYFSYNYLVTPVDSFNRPKKDLKSFKYDCFIDVNYEIRFRKFKHSFIYVGVGIGRMNISKKFDYNYPTGELDNNGNIVFTPRSTSLSFWAPRISVGFEFRKINAFVTAHYTPDEDLDSNPSLWVEYKLLYSFQLKKRKKKIN